MRSRIEQAIRAAIESGDTLTKDDVVSRFFCDMRTAQRKLKELHELEVTSIVKWHRQKGNPIPEYGAYRGKDAPKPSRLTPKQRSRANRKDPAYRDWENLSKRLRRQAAKGKTTTIKMTMLLGL